MTGTGEDMPKDTITLVLNGEVSLRDFSDAVGGLLALISGLQKEIAGQASIEWLVDSLDAGSATATVRGIPENGTPSAAVERVVHAYGDVGLAIRTGKQFNYSPPVKAAATRIVSLVKGRITSVRFETPDVDVEFSTEARPFEAAEIMQGSEYAYGATKGRVQSMTSRGQLRFTLYDLIDDRAISCYLARGSEDIMREAWGKLVLVEGLVRRDPETGRATTVREVKDIQIIPEGKPGDYREAIGAASGFLGDELPEEVIRRARDV
jgi:hypothetical protein